MLKLSFADNRYRVFNTGVSNVCNDILICSKLFGKITIDNELLLPGDYLETDHLVIGSRTGEVKECKGNRDLDRDRRKDRERSQDRERSLDRVTKKDRKDKWGDEERARAFTVKSSCPLTSNEVVTKLGVAFNCLASFKNTPYPDIYVYNLSIGNALESKIDAVNIRFTCRYTDSITKDNISNPTSDSGRFWYDDTGIHGYIERLKPGQTTDFSINLKISDIPKMYIWYSLIETDSPVLDKESLVINFTVQI